MDLRTSPPSIQLQVGPTPCEEEGLLGDDVMAKAAADDSSMDPWAEWNESGCDENTDGTVELTSVERHILAWSRYCGVVSP